MPNHTCPQCLASWDVVIDSLKECELTDNFFHAIGIVRNCRSCKAQLGNLAKECIEIALKNKEGVWK